VVGAQETTIERALTLETGSSDRLANMQAFSAPALELFETMLRG